MDLRCEAVATAALGPPLRRSGAEIFFRCSNHEDKHPSLQVNSKKNVWICGPCGVSGNAWQLAAFLARIDPNDIPAVTACLRECDLLDAGAGHNGSAPRIIAKYDYGDESGKLLFQVVRFEPKGFRQRRPDGNGEWIWNLNGVRRVLYRLPEVLKAKSALICEGEKDCEAAHKMGLVATCNSGGAGKWRAEYSEVLRDKHVAIIADADEPGRQHANHVATSLFGKAKSLRVIEFPNAKDLSEWVEKGGTRGQFLELVRSTPQWNPESATQPSPSKDKPLVSIYDCADFLQKAFQDASDHLVGTLIPSGGATLLYGLPRGLKSWLSLSIALDASCGRSVLGMFPVAAPVRTLLVQVEDRPTELQKRLALLIRSHGAQGPAPNMLRIIPRCPLNLLDAQWRLELEAALSEQGTELLILDVLRRLFRGDVSSAQDTATFLEILDRIRDTYRCAVLLVHHSKKARTGEMQTHALGSTNLAAWGDVLAQVKAKESQGTVTSVELEIEAKSEATPEPLTVHLDVGASPAMWATTGSGGGDYHRARRALSAQWTASDLERALGISQATAYRRIESWEREGQIRPVSKKGRGLAVYEFASETQILT